MFSCLQILEAFLWFVLITLLNVTLIILTLSVSRLLNLLLRLVAFLLFLNPQCLASIRSEERRVGKECRCQGWPNEEKKNQRYREPSMLRMSATTDHREMHQPDMK